MSSSLEHLVTTDRCDEESDGSQDIVCKLVSEYRAAALTLKRSLQGFVSAYELSFPEGAFSIPVDTLIEKLNHPKTTVPELLQIIRALETSTRGRLAKTTFAGKAFQQFVLNFFDCFDRLPSRKELLYWRGYLDQIVEQKIRTLNDSFLP